MADNADFEAHENTWLGFMRMMKWGTVAAALVGAFAVFLIAR